MDWNDQRGKVRLDSVCPLCLQDKPIGNLVCWPCHHSQKHHNDGDYSKSAKAKIEARDLALRGAK